MVSCLMVAVSTTYTALRWQWYVFAIRIPYMAACSEDSEPFTATRTLWKRGLIIAASRLVFKRLQYKDVFAFAFFENSFYIFNGFFVLRNNHFIKSIYTPLCFFYFHCQPPYDGAYACQLCDEGEQLEELCLDFIAVRKCVEE